MEIALSGSPIYVDTSKDTVEINSPIESKQRIGMTLGLLNFVAQYLENWSLTYGRHLHFFSG